MKRMNRLLFSAALSALIGFCATTSVMATTDYPSRTIKLMIGFSPGGNLDILARQAVPFLKKYLGGADIIVINRPGAGGAIMQTELSQAKPDGYTLGLLSMPGVVTVLFGSDIKYTINDFEYSGTFTFEPHSLMVGTKTPYHSLEDIVAAARKNPGQVTIGGAGIGSAAHLAVKVFERAADVSFNFIPSKGSAKMQSQVMGGHIEGGFTTVSGSLRRHEANEARVIGIMSAKRIDLAPNISTFIEAGFDVEWGALRGIAAPAGTSVEIMNKLTAAIKKTVNDPEFIALAKKNRQLLEFRDGASFEASVRKIYTDLEKIWAEKPWK